MVVELGIDRTVNCSGLEAGIGRTKRYRRCHRNRLIWRRATAAELVNVAEEYAQWVRDAPELAPAHRQIDGVNIKQNAQCSRDVFPFLRFAPATISYYLKTVVFPAEMKEFPHKLSSSGWDIAREKSHPTTGFSDTNDS
jgi:hypothetical protein